MSLARSALAALLILAFTSFVFAGGPASADPGTGPGDRLARLADLNFASITSRDGLPSDESYAVTEDSVGFVWIGTSGGLARYDGYHLRSYSHDANRPDSLPDDRVRALLPAADGGLWIGTESEGLVRYDPARDGFDRLPDEPADLRHSRVSGLASDGAGGVWCAHQNGLAHYRPGKEGGWEVFRRGDSSAFPHLQGFSVLQDHAGNIWAGGDHGLAVRRSGKFRFDPVRNEPRGGVVGSTPIWALFEDKAGRIWVGADGDGVGQVDPITARIRPVAGLSGPGSPVGTKTIRAFLEPVENQIWIATYGAGIVTIDTKTNEITHLEKDFALPAPLSNNYVRSLWQDQSGLILAATGFGLTSTSLQKTGIFTLNAAPTRKTGLTGTDVVSVNPGTDGRIWIGYRTGEVEVIDLDGTVHKVNLDPAVPASLAPQRDITRIVEGPNGVLLAASYGLYAIDPTRMTIRPFDDPLLRQTVITALAVQDQAFWVGTYVGLVRVDRASGQAQAFRHSDGDATSLPDNLIRGIVTAPDGNLWIATHNGLCEFNPATQHCRNFQHDPQDPASLSSSDLGRLVIGGDQRLWVSTNGYGINIIDNWFNPNPQGNSVSPHFHRMSATDVIPPGIVIQQSSNMANKVWLQSSSGLVSVDLASQYPHPVTPADRDLFDSMSLKPAAMLSDGTVLTPVNGAMAGLAVIRPDQLVPWSYRAPLVLTDVAIGTRHLPADVLEHAEPITLAAGETGLTADFALLDLSAPATTLYSYRLVGLGADWTIPTKDRHAAIYTNLAPGTYELDLRATSHDGHGPVSELHVPLIVLPAWYQTLWFYLILAAAALLFVTGLVYARTAQLRRRQHLLEALIKERTAELVESQRQLEKIAYLDALTNLPNRRMFTDEFRRMLAQAERGNRGFALLLIDLDRFKQINDTLGHDAGDALLIAAADRLRAATRTSDRVARLGGDEFAILLDDNPSAGEIDSVCQRIVGSFVAPVPFKEALMQTSPSIGVARYPQHGANDESLYKSADLALYEAKRAGRNTWRWYQPVSVP